MDKKKAAALRAVEMVESGMIVGLGTGSTAAYAIEAVGDLVANGYQLVCVPTSTATEEAARRRGLTLATIDEVGACDITIDGADEVDPRLNLIKGRGGALLREKIVAFSSVQEVIIVDDSKMVKTLGTKSPLPVEVLPFGYTKTIQALESLGCRATLKGREKPFLTDNRNYIAECRFAKIPDPELLEAEINLIPGVIENGLFIDMATKVVVADEKGVRVIEKNQE
jgi:ribose 5-phosphate isomerase A